MTLGLFIWASSYMVTGLVWLPGRILLSVHRRNISPVYREEIQETTKIVKHKLVSFAAVAALWTLVTY